MTPERHREIGKVALRDGKTVWQWVEAAIDAAFQDAAGGTRPIHFPADAVQLLEELLEASGTALTTGQYAAQSMTVEIWASLRKYECGVPEILAGSYQLEPGDMPAMQAVADRWRAKNEAVA